jgi:hypothetical protein
MITSYPSVAAMPYELAVAQGAVPGVSALFRSGNSDAITTTNTTVWPKGTLYSFLSSATTMTLYSSSNSDTTQSVLIEGLDSNYHVISEVVALNGQTGRATTLSYLRINTMTVLVDSPAGNISLGTGAATSGIPANTYGYIAATMNVTSSSVYTVPAGYTLYIVSGSLSAGDSSGSHSVSSNFLSRINGVVYDTAKIVLANGWQYFPYVVPLKIPEKSDLWNNTTASAGTASVAATFNGYLVKNP